ncbi:uncharacterized protein FYW49_003425 [Xenentodon cancila]
MCTSELSADSQPKLVVDRPVTTETDVVTLNCQTPASVSAYKCEFNTPSKSIYSGSSCTHILTGAELLSIEQRKSPVEIKVSCHYTVRNGGIASSSADSDMSTIIINNLRRPKLTVNPVEITETDSVTLNCQTPSSAPVDECYFLFGKGKPSRGFSCLKTLTGAELLSVAGQSLPANIDVTCFYLMSDPSPESTMSTVIIGYAPPKLAANPQLITESENLTLTCVTPSSVSVTECHLYFMRTKTSRTVSCVQMLTGAELLVMVHESSPAHVQLTCYYTAEQRGGRYQSPHSETCDVHIQGVEEKTSTTTQIMSTSSVTSGNYEAYDMITSVPGADGPAESVVHFYSTIPDDPSAPDQTAETYATICAH